MPFMRALVSLVALLSITMIFGCSTPESSEPSFSDNELHVNFKISVDGSTVQATGTLYGDEQFRTALTTSSTEDYNRIASVIRSKIGSNLPFTSIVIYLPYSLETEQSFNYSDIVGVAVYENVNGALNFRFFNRSISDEFSENVHLSGEVAGVESKSLRVIGMRLIGYSRAGKLTAVRLVDRYGRYDLSRRIDLGSDHLLMRVFVADSKRNRKGTDYVQTTADPHKKVKCGDNCPDNLKPKCGADYTVTGPNEPCSENTGICYMIDIRPPVDASNLVGGDTVAVAFDTTFAYEFRDSSLLKTYWGAKINAYYYGMSALLDTANVSLSTKVQTARTLYKFRAVMLKLLDPVNNSSQTLIGSTLKSELLALIDLYDSASSDTTYQNALDDLRSDINTYYNYTVGNFMSTMIAATDYAP